MLGEKNNEDVVSHLYVTEAYYFNPKQVKRSQLVRLVAMIQENLAKSGVIAKNPNVEEGQELRDKDQRRRNYFERKRWLNYPNTNAEGSENKNLQ